MPDLELIKTTLREILIREQCPRVPEPDLVMDDEKKFLAYVQSGTDSKLMMQSYLWNCAQICDVVRPGDKVVDLACGPATLLAMAARINPDVHFIGIDLSEGMLDIAREHAEREGLDNIEFRACDITDLDFAESGEISTVTSSFAFHHLSTAEDLGRSFAEIDRVLVPDGGLFLFDFAHLKSADSIEFFATRHAHLQSDFFTEDYRNSLRAAFYLSDIREQYSHYLSHRGKLYSTSPLPLMFAIKSPSRQVDTDRAKRELRGLRQELPAMIERDLKDIVRLFRFGGLPTTLLET